VRPEVRAGACSESPFCQLSHARAAVLAATIDTLNAVQQIADPLWVGEGRGGPSLNGDQRDPSVQKERSRGRARSVAHFSGGPLTLSTSGDRQRSDAWTKDVWRRAASSHGVGPAGARSWWRSPPAPRVLSSMPGPPNERHGRSPGGRGAARSADPTLGVHVPLGCTRASPGAVPDIRGIRHDV
jgi:hypothetical protein